MGFLPGAGESTGSGSPDSSGGTSLTARPQGGTPPCTPSLQSLSSSEDRAKEQQQSLEELRRLRNAAEERLVEARETIHQLHGLLRSTGSSSDFSSVSALVPVRLHAKGSTHTEMLNDLIQNSLASRQCDH